MVSREIVEVTQSHRQQLIDIYSEAFVDDPMFQWLSSEPCFARFVFEAMTEHYINLGFSCVLRDGGGATLWQGPEQRVKESLALGLLWRGLRRYGWRSLYRVLAVDKVMHQYHPIEPHFYLFAIATLVASRGQGVGSSLIAHTLRLADEMAVGVYLENSKQKNLAFYRGHGFEVVRELAPLKGAPTLYLMWRQPRKMSSS